MVSGSVSDRQPYLVSYTGGSPEGAALHHLQATILFLYNVVTTTCGIINQPHDRPHEQECSAEKNSTETVPVPTNQFKGAMGPGMPLFQPLYFT